MTPTDQSQLEYYEEIVKRMPVRVLKNHGMVESDGKEVRLPICGIYRGRPKNTQPEMKGDAMKRQKRMSLDILELASALRADSSIDWSGIVRSADWMMPLDQMSEGLDWVAAEKDLRARLPAELVESWMLAAVIARAERETGKPFGACTSQDMEIALNAMPGVYSPNLLSALWRRKLVDAQFLRRVLLSTWKFTDLPSHPVSTRVWRAMFRCAGFLSDGAERPKRPVTVYRGCTPRGRGGLAWTSDRGLADHFADYWFKSRQAKVRGNVYKARVKPKDVLAIIRGVKSLPDGSFESTEFGRPEAEYICDVRSATVVLVETPRQREARDLRREKAEAALQERRLVRNHPPSND